jgi:hypothetical protein
LPVPVRNIRNVINVAIYIYQNNIVLKQMEKNLIKKNSRRSNGSKIGTKFGRSEFSSAHSIMNAIGDLEMG